MSIAPKTRNSLILRLRNREDVDSWREFVAIYQPVVFRVAKSRGLQDADAQELVQRVLMAVARAVDRFQPDTQRARFRTWLYRITHNEFCKELASAKKHKASGDSAVRELLENLPQESDDEFSIEYRRSVFRWAADRVRPKVKPSTWLAFWRTSVLGQSSESVADDLGLSTGAVYVARSRVMARLQREATKFEDQS
ncbi:MAG: sigma-70 family RNA polymerase sigma factor [Planctomycetota bacterium]